MTRAAIACFLLCLAVGCTPARQAEEIKRVQVTAESMSAEPAPRPYIVDLTRGGTLYEVAEGIDPSLVAIRAPSGTVPLSALARRFAGRRSPLLIGTLDDLSAHDFGFPPDNAGPQGGEATAAECIKATAESPGICSCRGKKDCNDMNKAGFCYGGSNRSAVCGPDANGKWGCSCLAAGS